MRLYTAHLRAGEAAAAANELVLVPELALVKEGFSWPAFLFTVVWALALRLWLVALAFLAASLVVSGLLDLLGFDLVARVAAGLAFQLLVGYLANDLRRWTLARRGWREVGPVAASDRLAAERRFFDHHPAVALDAGRAAHAAP